MAQRAILRAILAAVTLALVAAPATAQVPDPFARELSQRLTRVDQVVANQGYQRAAGPFSGGLQQGQRQSFNLTLRAGQDYRMVGVCEGRCSDLDMRLRGPNGALLSEDILPDNVPVLSVRPGLTGAHAVEIDMSRCGAPRCWFAFNVYAR